MRESSTRRKSEPSESLTTLRCDEGQAWNPMTQFPPAVSVKNNTRPACTRQLWNLVAFELLRPWQKADYNYSPFYLPGLPNVKYKTGLHLSRKKKPWSKESRGCGLPSRRNRGASLSLAEARESSPLKVRYLAGCEVLKTEDNSKQRHLK